MYWPQTPIRQKAQIEHSASPRTQFAQSMKARRPSASAPAPGAACASAALDGLGLSRRSTARNLASSGTTHDGLLPLPPVVCDGCVPGAVFDALTGLDIDGPALGVPEVREADGVNGLWDMLSDEDVVSGAGLNGSATTVNVVPGAVMIVWVAEV
jgi:hypothetical protein